MTPSGRTASNELQRSHARARTSNPGNPGKKDVIACAQTGTGKLRHFYSLNNLQTDEHDEGKINAIIMAPTGAGAADRPADGGFLLLHPVLRWPSMVGTTEKRGRAEKGLLSGADVVISTPGRLLSHINLYNIDFSGIKYFILDEADRMLDMGFHEDIMKIEKLLPKERQTVMSSATMPPKIQQLAKTILRDPEEITIAIARPPETILQSAYICEEGQKIGDRETPLQREETQQGPALLRVEDEGERDCQNIAPHAGLSVGGDAFRLGPDAAKSRDARVPE